MKSSRSRLWVILGLLLVSGFTGSFLTSKERTYSYKTPPINNISDYQRGVYDALVTLRGIDIGNSIRTDSYLVPMFEWKIKVDSVRNKLMGKHAEK